MWCGPHSRVKSILHTAEEVICIPNQTNDFLNSHCMTFMKTFLFQTLWGCLSGQIHPFPQRKKPGSSWNGVNWMKNLCCCFTFKNILTKYMDKWFSRIICRFLPTLEHLLQRLQRTSQSSSVLNSGLSSVMPGLFCLVNQNCQYYLGHLCITLTKGMLVTMKLWNLVAGTHSMTTINIS